MKNKKIFLFFLVLTFFSFVLFACSDDEQKKQNSENSESDILNAYDSDEVLMRIGDAKILYGDFAERVILTRENWSLSWKVYFGEEIDWNSEDGRKHNLEIQNSIIQQLVEELYVYFAFDKLGLVIEEEDIDEFVDEFIDFSFEGDRDAFLDDLLEFGETEDEFRENIIIHMKSIALVDYLTKDFEISEEEILEFYEEKYLSQFDEDAEEEPFDLEDIRDEIERAIRQEKGEDKIQDFFDDLRENYEPEFNETILLPVG